MTMKIFLDKNVVFDTPVYRNDNYRWCHLTAKNIELLHQFAQSIGLKREWFQDKPKRPHYDIRSKIIRRKAVAKGAIEIESKQFIEYQIHYYGN